MIGQELRTARRMAGVSQATLGSAVGLSDSEVSRIEHGAADWLTVVRASELLGTVGLSLWGKTFPEGPPLRDAAHLRLLAEFEARLAPTVRSHREWPIPTSRDRRAVDLVLSGLPRSVGVEAETVLEDLQALEREVNLKQRDAGLAVMLLWCADRRGTAWSFEEPKRSEGPSRFTRAECSQRWRPAGIQEETAS